MSKRGSVVWKAVWLSIALGCSPVKPAASAPEPARASQPTPTPVAARTRAPAPAPALTAVQPKLAELCPEMCKRSSALECAQAAQCEALCAAQTSDMPCRELMHAFMSCALREKAEHWECGELGVASLRDGYCDAEQASFAQCLGALDGA